MDHQADFVLASALDGCRGGLLVIDGHRAIANGVFLFMVCHYGGACSFLAQSFSNTGMTITVM